MHVVQKLYADGRIEDCAEKMTLAQLQGFVGGLIERVASRVPDRALIINEEGVLEDLPTNHAATKLVRAGTLMDGGIRGNALLVKA